MNRYRVSRLIRALVAALGLFVLLGAPPAGAVALNLVPGWNLVGNSVNEPLTVATTFNISNDISTVWKWLPGKSAWAFYSPTLPDGGAAYAAGKGYEFLTTINGGEGFWVNARTPTTIQLPTGTAIASTTVQLVAPGWNLIAVGDNPTPSQFSALVGTRTPLATLWAWDSTQSSWYFYAPGLEAAGGTALADYIYGKSYLGFGIKALDPTMGFWVNAVGATTMSTTTTTGAPTTTTALATTTTTAVATTTTASPTTTTSSTTTSTTTTSTTSSTTASTTTTTLSGSTSALQAGDYWEFEWSQSSASSSSSGTTSTSKDGVFRVTLGSPLTLGGRTALPIVIGGDATIGKPRWTHLAADGQALLGTHDGVTYSTIFGGDQSGWKGAGFFAFFPPDRTGNAYAGTYKGNYKTLDAWVVARSSTGGGCTYYAEIAGDICEQDYTSYSEEEYEKSGVGPIGYKFKSSAMYQGGGIITTHDIVHTIELVKSSKTASDGTAFNGPPWSALPNLPSVPSWPTAGANGGALLVFGANPVSGGWPWLAFDPVGASWSDGTFDVQTAKVLGVSGDYLYYIGRIASATAPLSLLRLDAALTKNESLGTTPAFKNLCGGAALASGELVALDCPGLSSMAIYIFNPTTGIWRSGASYSGTRLRPAIAAVGNDVYIFGGYLNSWLWGGQITGTVSRYRATTDSWDTLPSAMPTPRDEPFAVTVGNKVYVMGGSGTSSSVPSGRVVEIFDAASGTWTTGPTMAQARSNFTAAALDGRIYVIGGTGSSNAWLDSASTLSP